MFGAKTILIAALCYVVFVWLKADSPHLEEIPLPLVVLGCLVLGYFGSIPTGSSGFVAEEPEKKSLEEHAQDAKKRKQAKAEQAAIEKGLEAEMEADPIRRIALTTYRAWESGRLATYYPDTKKTADQMGRDGFVRDILTAEVTIRGANEIRPFADGEFIWNHGKNHLITSRTFYVAHPIHKKAYDIETVVDVEPLGKRFLSHTIHFRDGSTEDLEIKFTDPILDFSDVQNQVRDKCHLLGPRLFLDHVFDGSNPLHRLVGNTFDTWHAGGLKDTGFPFPTLRKSMTSDDYLTDCMTYDLRLEAAMKLRPFGPDEYLVAHLDYAVLTSSAFYILSGKESAVFLNNDVDDVQFKGMFSQTCEVTTKSDGAFSFSGRFLDKVIQPQIVRYIRDRS